MATEIERKFLIKGDFKPYVNKSITIKQGYLSRAPERTVRVRTYNDKAYITIKGKASNNGLSRYEFEKEIPYNDALDLLKICEKGIIDKTRHLVEYKNHTFEVDEFNGDNQGLILAEIELRSEDESFEKPEWLGKEVTEDHRYSNSNLSSHPFIEWKQ